MSTAETRPDAFGCWIVHCITCPWLSETCRDLDALVAAHRIHTEHLLGLAGANRELTAGEMAEHLPQSHRAAYWDRQIGRYFGDEPSGAAASVHACEGHGRGPTDACAYLASKGEQR